MDRRRGGALPEWAVANPAGSQNGSFAMNTTKTMIIGLGLISGACAACSTSALAAVTAANGPPPAAAAMGAGFEYPVWQLQEALNAHGANIQVDGVYGPQTQAALQAYQHHHGLIASGELDHPTRASLGLLA